MDCTTRPHEVRGRVVFPGMAGSRSPPAIMGLRGTVAGNSLSRPLSPPLPAPCGRPQGVGPPPPRAHSPSPTRPWQPPPP